MTINTIEYAKLMQKQLDQAAIIGATSGWMAENAGQVIYNGGDEVKIPTMGTVGLADYDRDKGFVQGGISVKYNTYKLTQDRGRTFMIDSMDLDESGFVATSANAIKVFQNEHVIPELDSYRYSKIAAIAEKAGQNEALGLTADNVVKKLLEHIMTIQDQIGYDKNLVITIAGKAWALLNGSADFKRGLAVDNFKQGEINTRVYNLNGNIIKPVPAGRMKTKYESLDGTTSGQEAGGLKAAADAKDINWIITPKSAPIAVSKTDKLRVFTPDINQQADAYKIDFRVYHDLWIKKGDEKSIFVCTGA